MDRIGSNLTSSAAEIKTDLSSKSPDEKPTGARKTPDNLIPQMKSVPAGQEKSVASHSSSPGVWDEDAVRKALNEVISNIHEYPTVNKITERLTYLAVVADESSLKLVIDTAKKIETLTLYEFLEKIGRTLIKSGNTEAFERLRRHEPDFQFTEGMEIAFKTSDLETATEPDIVKSISITKLLLKEGVPISDVKKIELSQWASQRGENELIELIKSSGKMLSSKS